MDNTVKSLQHFAVLHALESMTLDEVNTIFSEILKRKSKKATLVIDGEELIARVFEYVSHEDLAKKIIESIPRFWSFAVDIFHVDILLPEEIGIFPNSNAYFKLLEEEAIQKISEKYKENPTKILEDINFKNSEFTSKILYGNDAAEIGIVIQNLYG